MLLTAMHMDSTHAPSSSASTSPWLPALADHHHQLLYEEFAASSTPSTSPPPPAHRHLLRAAPRSSHRRVANKRRPRPSRRLPTTYITADPASFRRMVHQVTGADHLSQPPPEILCRPALIGNSQGIGAGALVLPTLDTSAFLLGAAGVLARTGADAPSDGSAALAPAPALEVQTGGGGGGACNNGGSNFGGFPTLESWDALF